MDGIACGSHGHRDANCLIRFTDNDRVWLVDDSYTEGPFLSDHNGVLVVRDGIAEPMPALARLDAAVDFDEVGITRTTLPDHSGVDRRRNVLWIKEKCFVVLDRMMAVQPGDYGFRCRWRTLGTATLDGNRLTTRQERATDAASTPSPPRTPTFTPSDRPAGNYGASGGRRGGRRRQPHERSADRRRPRRVPRRRQPSTS